jgi:hypothetical protein
MDDTWFHERSKFLKKVFPLAISARYYTLVLSKLDWHIERLFILL